MTKRYLGCGLFVACGMALYGQGDYYRTVEGLKEAELKTALHSLIQPMQVLDYGGKGEGYTWAGFALADRMPDGITVRDRYSDVERQFNGLEAVQGMNIEHVFANSWWGHTVNNAYCDLFNLFPSDASANGRKSNNPMGVVTGDVSYDNGVMRVGRSTSYRADSLITVWEPADEWKGDFARTFFYMATCYEDMLDEWQTAEGLLVVSPNRYPTLRPWVSRLLLEWSEANPVDDIERSRNETVYGIQGNRNPFVDYPQLAAYIWGDSTEYAFYTDRFATTPELFVPQAGGTADYGLQASSRGMQAQLAVRGRNLPDGLTLSVDNTDFALGQTELTAEEIVRGIAIPITCRPGLAAGRHEAMLTLSSEGFEQDLALAVEFVDGVPAYPASDVVCSVNTKRFLASWMDMGEATTYELQVYTKDEAGVAMMLEGYPQQTTATSVRVENLKASTTYYYRVGIVADDGQAGMLSNEVEVAMPAVTPVFSANVSEMTFSSVPNRPSTPQTVSLTTLELPQYVTTVTTDAPFELSADGENWGTSLTLTGYGPQFQVRLGSLPEAGIAESELVISAPGVREIVVSLTGEADAAKSFFEPFEAGSKNAYAEGQVTCGAATWRMSQAVIGNLENDRKNDGKSVRMRVYSNAETVLEMLDDKTEGCDSLWFYAGLYGTDTGAKLSVSYSLDGGISWVPVATEMGFVRGEWQRYGFKLDVDGLVRLRFAATGTSSRRLNVDDIQMSDYAGEPGDGVETVTGSNPDELVDVFTLGGIKLRTAPRKEALRGLKPDYYIVK